MPNAEVTDVMEHARQQIPRAVSRLKRLYGLTDQQLADALGIGRREFASRRSGETRFTTPELAGLAYLFDLPLGAFLLDLDELGRAVIANDGGLDAPFRRMPMPHQAATLVTDRYIDSTNDLRERAGRSFELCFRLRALRDGTAVRGRPSDGSLVRFDRPFREGCTPRIPGREAGRCSRSARRSMS